MCSLTDPEYFIGAPAALSATENLADAMKIIGDFSKFIEEQDRIYNTGYSDYPSEKFKEFYRNQVGDSSFDFNNIDGDTKAALEEMLTPPKVETTEDDPEEVARLQGLDFSGIYDDATIEALTDNFKNASTAFSTFMDNYQNWRTSNGSYTELYNGMRYKTGKELERILAYKGVRQAKHLFKGSHDSPFDRFNFTSPFIPLLGNTCTQVTGGKDFTLNEHQYEEDEFSASQKVATGMDETWGPGTLSTTFTDMAYGPVSLMFMVWVLYIHYVSRGRITTTRQHVLERILDYTCSIYVFVLGEDGRRIERWGKFTGCYPTTFPITSQLEHNTTVEQDMLQKVTISWTYNRYEPMDPQVFTDFNFLSESEWLVKLKEQLWENHYSREDSAKSLASYFLDIAKDTDEEKRKLQALHRPQELWRVIRPEDYGMSGKVPTPLIEPMPRTNKYAGFSLDANGNSVFKQQSAQWRKDSKWYIDSMTNYWGGYPYITRASEFIWVLPQWSENRDNYADKANDERSNGVVNNGADKYSKIHVNVPSNNSEYEGENTGFSHHLDKTDANTDLFAGGYFVGNGALNQVT
jgi:hypothetical protein